MSRNEWESDWAGGSAVGVQLEPSDEVMAGWRRRVIAGPVSAGRRLLRVLVVDNDRDATDSLSILVSMWGHEVRRAYGGIAALEMAFAYQPDVVFLDIAMPQKTGCQVAMQLRHEATTKGARLIAITGYTDEAHRRLCEYAGFDDFLIKPVPVSVVEELLARERRRLEELPKTFRAAPREYGLVVVGDSASHVKGY